MRQTGEREWPLAFDPPTFRALLATLARHRRPVELALLLQCVEDSGARLPRACFDAAAAAPASGGAAAAGEDFFAPDGRTPLTSWLATSPEAVRALDAAVLHQRGARQPCLWRCMPGLLHAIHPFRPFRGVPSRSTHGSRSRLVWVAVPVGVVAPQRGAFFAGSRVRCHAGSAAPRRARTLLATRAVRAGARGGGPNSNDLRGDSSARARAMPCAALTPATSPRTHARPRAHARSPSHARASCAQGSRRSLTRSGGTASCGRWR